MPWLDQLIRSPKWVLGLIVAWPSLFAAPFVFADSLPYSPMIAGPLGLNTVPSARMDEAGTARIGTSTLDPYVHGYLGLQFTDGLYVGLRQSAEVSEFNEDPDDLYPGVDLKIRLLKERENIPEISMGFQSLVGDKRLSGEYLTFSKRLRDFDITGGIGWGRFGSANHIRNPLSVIGSHFEDDRDASGEETHEPHDWFTGKDAAFFGGVEYFTPVKGLSLKLDFNADRFIAEENNFGFDVPAAWSAGVNYQPVKGVNMALATQGGEKIMGNVSISSMIQKWPSFMKALTPETQPVLAPYRKQNSTPQDVVSAARAEGLRLSLVESNTAEMRTVLQLDPDLPFPYQAGRAFVHMANHACKNVERLTITPAQLGLTGATLSVQRRDLENMLRHHNGSPEEVWRHTIFTQRRGLNLRKLNRLEDFSYEPDPYYVGLENDVSLAEEDSTALFRTSVLLGSRVPGLLGWLDYGIATRLNVAENLDRLQQIRPLTREPIRADVAYFADRGIALEHQYLAFTHSLSSEVHFSLIGGYLEEMFGGYGGEVLYRPFKSRFAIGAEAYKTYKRNPYTSLNLGLERENDPFSSHVNLFYDWHEQDVNLKAKIGRYLADDFGGTLSIQKRFRNGARLDGFLTLTDDNDTDLFGGSTNAFHGVRFHYPLGGLHELLKPSYVTFDTEPLGRDTGQSIRNPIPLYELTEQFSYSHTIKNWSDINR